MVPVLRHPVEGWSSRGSWLLNAMLMIDGISGRRVAPAFSPWALRALSVDDDDVSGAAGPVPAELPELAGFRPAGRVAQRGVAVN